VFSCPPMDFFSKLELNGGNIILYKELFIRKKIENKDERNLFENSKVQE